MERYINVSNEEHISIERCPSLFNQDEVLYKLDGSKRLMKNIVFLVIFIINSIVAIVLSYSFIFTSTTKIPISSASTRMAVTILVPLTIAILLFFILIVFMITASKVYIASSYLLTALILFILMISLSVSNSSYLPLVLLIGLIMSIVYFFLQRRELEHSGQMCAVAASILVKYPASFGFMFLSLLPTIIFTDSYAAISSHMSATDLSGWYHIYLSFSYFWIINFIVYVCDYVFSGVTVLHFFFGGTTMMIRYPIFKFFKFSFSYSFGSIAYAAAIAPWLWLIRAIPPSWYSRCTCNSSELSLVYCSSLGTAFSEGSRRFYDLQKQIGISNLIFKSAIYSAGYLITWALSFVGCAIGYYISMQFVKDRDIIVITTIFTWAMTYFCIRSLVVSINGMADALFILFGGSNLKFKQKFPMLHQSLLARQNSLRE